MNLWKITAFKMAFLDSAGYGGRMFCIFAFCCVLIRECEVISYSGENGSWVGGSKLFI